MPVLTKEQVLEAAFELDEQEREEVIARLKEERAVSPQLSEEHKQIIRDEIAAHRRDPSTSVSRDEVMAKMRAAL